MGTGTTGRCSRIFGRHRLSGQDGVTSPTDHPVLYSTLTHKPVHTISRDVPSLLPPCQAKPYDKSSRHAPSRGTSPGRPTRPVSADETNRRASTLETRRDRPKRATSRADPKRFYPQDEASHDIPADYPNRRVACRKTCRDGPKRGTSLSRPAQLTRPAMTSPSTIPAPSLRSDGHVGPELYDAG
jgi:hypothetical protein